MTGTKLCLAMTVSATLLCASRSALAQAGTAADSAIASRIPSADSGSTPDAARPGSSSKRRFLTAGGVVAATLALAPLDHSISEQFRRPHWKGNDRVRDAADALAFVGGPGPFVVGSGLVLGGVVVRRPGVIGAGVRVTESVLLAAAVTGLAKGFTGRALPGVTTTHDFSFGRGFHSGNGPWVSFPSGHTAASFALAGSITAEIDRASPGLGQIVGPIAFGTAAMVGVARVYQQVHWPSDLPLGAAIGIWSARRFRPAQQSGPPERESALDRAVSGASLTPSRHGGLTLSWSSARMRTAH